MKIKKLSHELASQIAAGEVVERPASVVKELVENCLDAKASQIDIALEKGGMRLIKITDNGEGIAQEDLPLALSPHATSKIAMLDDLDAIMSLGFRGEALASIASVSRCRIMSKVDDAEAYSIVREGVDNFQLLPVGHAKGTTVEINDLFFNVPARRKFLKSEKTEYDHIELCVKRLSLSHFNVGFTLTHNDSIKLQLPPAITPDAQERRVGKIVGKSFLEHAIHIDTEIHGLRLTGWLGLPSYHASQTQGQYAYLNQRMVRDRVINHAIRQSYGDDIPEGRYPAYVLFLSVEPNTVDVNVHPTKHEVRFHESRLVHDFLVDAITRSLAQTEDVSLPSYQALSDDTYEYSEEIAPRHVAQPRQSVSLIPLQNKQFVIKDNGEEIYLIDIRKVVVEAMKTAFKEDEFKEDSKTLLMPIVFHMVKMQSDIDEKLQWLQAQGIDIAYLGETKFIIRALPSLCRALNMPATLNAWFSMSSEQDAYAKTFLKAMTLSDERLSMDTVAILLKRVALSTVATRIALH